jgi:sialic acid synthase SpsE
LLIAEIGNNHEGDFDVACRLVREAAACGADAVKFQTFRTEHYVSRRDAERFARLKRFELSYAQFSTLRDLAAEQGLLFFSTPFDIASAEFLGEAADAIKIASGDNNFYPLIECAARSRKPLIVSTGATDEAGVQAAVEHVERICGAQWAAKNLALLHCVSSYPVPDDQANLRSIAFLKRAYPSLTIGYSDHTVGCEAAVLAVALGAEIIEKHFTLDHHYSDFRDHQLSADPREMRALVGRVRQAIRFLGTEEKRVLPCEAQAQIGLRRSVVAGADLASGHRLRVEDLTWVRPAGGLAPGAERELIGKRLTRAVSCGDPLALNDVEA